MLSKDKDKLRINSAILIHLLGNMVLDCEGNYHLFKHTVPRVSSVTKEGQGGEYNWYQQMAQTCLCPSCSLSFYTKVLNVIRNDWKKSRVIVSRKVTPILWYWIKSNNSGT